MTQDAYSIISTTFAQIWRLFNSWFIPGTNVTPAGWFLFLIVAGLGIRTFKRIITRDISDNSGGRNKRDA